jgi:HEPN domain-containing protein
MATGGFDYRNGALDRLEEASILLRNGRFEGSVYLAGRAVEGMLRAVIWEHDREYALGKKTLDTGHD